MPMTSIPQRRPFRILLSSRRGESLTHALSELNQWTGVFTAISAGALVLCVYGLGRLENLITSFWQDYRKVNDLDQREEMESEV